MNLLLRYSPFCLVLLLLSGTVAPTRIRFAVIGDYGKAGTPEKRVADLVKSWKPDFIITTGDNNYPRGAAETIDENIGQYYADYIYPYRGKFGAGAAKNRFFPALGNHDLYEEEGKAYFDYFTLPGNERYYDFVMGQVHFFVLNSDASEPDGIARDSRQATWLKLSLGNSRQPWKIVVLHRPPFSSGKHGPAPDLQWPFADWGVSAVLAGHDHIYERIELGRLVYFVNGVGGNPKLYRIDGVASGSKVRFVENYGAMLVEAHEREIRFEFYTIDGVLRDSLRKIR